MGDAARLADILWRRTRLNVAPDRHPVAQTSRQNDCWLSSHDPLGQSATGSARPIPGSDRAEMVAPKRTLAQCDNLHTYYVPACPANFRDHSKLAAVARHLRIRHHHIRAIGAARVNHSVWPNNVQFATCHLGRESRNVQLQAPATCRSGP